MLINVIVLIITISFHLLRSGLWTGNTCTMTLCVSPLWTYCIYALHRQDGVGGLELIPLIVASSYHIHISTRLIVWAWHIFEGVVSWCPLFRSEFVLESTHLELDFCLLSGIEKRLLLGGCVSTTIMLNPIRNMMLVRCREVVLFSEGPLSEARL